MKKLLLFLSSAFLFLLSGAQTVRTINMPGFQQFGGSSTQTRFNGVVYPVVGYAPAIYIDTAAANSNSYVDNIPFAHIATTGDGKMWYRNLTATAWIEWSGGSSSAWNLTGNSGTVPGTNFVGTTDSVGGLAFKNGIYYNAFYERRTWDVFPYIGRPGLTAVGTRAAQNLIAKIVAGTDNGGLNTIIGGEAGFNIGNTYDGIGTGTSNQNTFIGVWAGHDIQNNSTNTGTGRNVLIGESSCFFCLTPGENTLVGTFSGERGNRGYKNTALGSNSLRTMGDAYGMTSLGAYSSAYTGTVVSGVTITSGGSGYTTATVTFSAPPTGTAGSCAATATGTATISGGQIISIEITNPGCGYNATAGTRYPGYDQPFPTVTITGDGTGATGTVVLRSANNSVVIGHVADWFGRANQYGIYIGTQSNSASTRYWDNNCAAFGAYSGIDNSISPLQGMTKAWAFGYGARVSENNTMTFGGVPSDTNTVKFVINGIRGDSSLNIDGVNGGGINATGGATIAKDAFINSVRVGRGSASLSTNTAVGDSALFSVSTSPFNTGLGQGALKSVATGSGYNTMIGYGAGRTQTSSSYNTGIGALALSSITSGSAGANTAGGAQSLMNATGGFWNTAYGVNTMYSFATPSRFGQGVNTVVGANAGYNLTGGEANSFFGERTGGNVSTGVWNVAIGNQALGSTSTGSAGVQIDGNVAVGVLAMGSSTGGNYTTSVGYGAGRYNTGNYNLYLGTFNATGVGTRNNHGYISDGQGNVRIMFDSLGNVNIGNGSTLPTTSALLDLTSTTRGFLAPRMTAVQRAAITSPAAGLLVWDTDSSRFLVNNGSGWKGIKYTDEGGGGTSGITVGTTTITSGTSTRVPFNDGGVYSEDAGFTFNKTTDVLTVGSGISFNGTSSVGQGTLFGSPGLINQINAGERWMVVDNGPSGAILDLQTGSYPSYDNATFYINARTNTKQGADVASAAGAITLGRDGNVFEITGTSAITAINNTNWQNGATVTLLFTSTASLTHGTANSGTSIGFELAGAANFNGTAGDVVVLVLSEIGGTQRWRMVSQSVN